MLRIGPVTLATNLLLAPIAGYCDLAWRLVCRSYNRPDGAGGLGIAFTDLLSPQGLLRGTATSLDLARTHDLDQPIGMQLYGSDPVIMAEGALWAAQHGAKVVDINMGCPVDKVCKKDGGSRLLCIPDTAEAIVKACTRVLEPLNIPLTCKMRLGWFDGQPVAESLAPRLIDAGACMITVHGRTTEQKFTGVVNHDGIARVVESVGRHCRAAGHRVPVIGNGDVREPQDAVEMIRRTGCDGVMIGRGALSTPWIFRDAAAMLAGEPVPAAPTRGEILAMAGRYLDLMLEFRGEHYAMVQIRRRISWIGKRLTPCRPLKDRVRAAKAPDEVRAALAWFAGADPGQFAPEADSDLVEAS